MSTSCPACGNSVAAGDQFCRVCGRQVPASVAAASPAAPSAPPQTSVKAVVSLVCGLLFFVPLAFIAAIVFGHIGLSEIKRSAGRLKGEGMAIAGLVLGYLWIVSIPVMLIIAAIAIPNLLRARMAANESSAVASIRVINTAEVAYMNEHATEGFTCSLSALAEAHEISANLVQQKKNGYRFELSGCAPGTDGTPITSYKVVAYPVTVNQTGMRAFCSDESAAIKVDAGGSAARCLEGGEALQ
jgi:type IV pilus assembly protein PilA